MMNFKITCLISVGFAVLSPFALAADPVDQPDQNGDQAYIGSNGRIGIGYDTKTNLRGDAYWIFSERDLTALIGEGWISGAAGGLKLNYQWVPGGKQGLSANPSVRKLFAAIDQNQYHDQKLTLGGGIERENIFYGGYVSAALTGKRTISDISSSTTQTISGTDPSNGLPYTQDVVTTTSSLLTERPYDYGVGARVGRYFDQPLIRLTGGLDYEWGRDSNRQTTVSMKLEKYIAHTPHSFSVDAELYDQSGPLDHNPGNKRLFFMYHYEFGGKNYRPEHPSHMVEAPADNTQPEETAPGPASAVPVDSAPRMEQRMVKTTASMNSDAFFEFDKSKLTPAAKSALDSVIATLKKSGYSGNIHLTGHTCNIGTVEYNQKLSERRALSVKKYMVEVGGIPADSIIAEGKGELDPTYPNTRAMRPKNRRVDLEFVTYAEKLEDVELPPVPAAEAPSAKPAPAKVQWVREYIDVEPAWMRRALHNTIPHKESVDVYHQQETTVTVSNGDKQYVPNHPPIARDDIFTIGTQAPSVLNVLANDSDPDGDPLTIISFTQPSTGTITAAGNGNLIFTPSGTFPWNHFASASFSYTISDGKGGTATATATMIDP